MKRKMIVGAVLLSLGMMLGGCADLYTLQQAYRLTVDREREEEAESNPEEPESTFGAVPYFRDDTGRDAQEVDGYLYGFWGGRFCRYNLDTWEETLLYEAPCNQAGNFFIQGEDIYFLTRHGADSLDQADICLYRMKLDGSELTLLCDNIPDIYDRIWDNYEIDIYQDIVYLTGNYYTPDICYRLEGDRAVSVEKSETLYGTIPAGYESLEDRYYRQMPSVAYMMRHYGYLLVRDRETHDLYRFDPEEGVVELFWENDTLEEGKKIVEDAMFLTNAALYFCDSAFYDGSIGQWYRLPLEGGAELEKWIQTSIEGTPWSLELFWNEEGVWLIDTLDVGTRRVFWAAWDDVSARSVRTIWHSHSEDTASVFSDQAHLFFRDEKAFYFNQQTEAGDAIVRLADDETLEEVFAIFDTSRVRKGQLCDKRTETYEIYWNPDYSNYSYSYSIRLHNELLYLTEDTKAAQKINAYLERIYQERRKVDPLDIFDEEMLREWAEFGYDGSYWDVDMYVAYLNEDYLCVGVNEGGFYAMGAHPNYMTDYYVFSLATGERLSITDLVEESEEEICNIIAPYVELTLSFDQWTPRESILEIDRFFLNESGIGIHFDTYEMASYADGVHDFVIPFEEFTMKYGK